MEKSGESNIHIHNVSKKRRRFIKVYLSIIIYFCVVAKSNHILLHHSNNDIAGGIHSKSHCRWCQDSVNFWDFPPKILGLER